MEMFFNELRESLLQAGIAPRHVKRYLTELAEHFADLTAAEQGVGLNPAAQSAARIRLGTADNLANAFIQQPQFQSWSTRAPLAIFGAAPLLFLAAAWFVACFILWSGWQIFLPGTDTPFVPVNGFAILYFGLGRLLYFSAPLIIGWAIGLTAARQRHRAHWPCLGFALVALAASAFQVHASRLAVPGATGQVSMRLAPSLLLSSSLAHAAVYFSLMLLPYLLWRLKKTLSPSAF
jgi:hypothetical protein